ncbi:oligosaccharide flippase family protein [Trueperella bernardiae]|uniref:Oligosaccharide flippase family protein n=1 Tax=Trueperella bernardiae TaxID=59561 RepID=A0AAW6ZIB5_9ACTO|nr:oligosaccharide flippase family protein [Trueperella bernardiae]MDK8601467.1 oligosaccharide flippase family protein [Trueperella bernardiae]MDV6238357.1 oligosaccharide flippase family protein [Trueperella bernardiae]WIM08260.1 oligosaccharide flippase family protein [Trueperella bernardiae]
MSRAWAWASSELSRRPVMKNILVLLTGSTLAQIVAMVISIFTARIFTPEDFGAFGIYGSITGVLVTVASLRYDMTIVLPDSDDEARVIGKLATRINLAISISAAVLAFLLRDVVYDVWGNEIVATWLPLGGLTVFLLAQVNILSYWHNRKRNYNVISMNRVEQTIGSAGGQLAFGLGGMASMAGLLLGTLLGQVWAFFRLGISARDFRSPVGPDAPSMRAVATTYKKMPLLNLPNALIDSVRVNGIQMLVGLVAVGSLGQLNLAWRTLQVPISLINGAVSQVFYRELAEVKPGNMVRLVRKTAVRSFLFGMPPFILLYLISPWLFTFVFGAQWDQAGDFARALTPWLAMQLITSPISTVFVVTSKQHWMLIFSIVFCVAPLTVLALNPFGLIGTITAMSWIMAVLLAFMILMAVWASRAYDRTVIEHEGDE